MGYCIFDRVYKKKPFQTEELRGQTFRNFKHVSVSCIKWCVYKKYTYGFLLGFWKLCLNATTCKMIHFWEKDREERVNFEGSLKARTVHCRPTTFCFYRRLWSSAKTYEISIYYILLLANIDDICFIFFVCFCNSVWNNSKSNIRQVKFYPLPHMIAVLSNRNL